MSDIQEFQSAKHVLFFEFDHLVVNMREATFEVLKTLFEDQDLSPTHMSRYGLQGTPAAVAESVQDGLGVKKGTPRKVGEEIINGINMHVDSGLVMVSDELRNVLVAARDRGHRLVGVSSLPETYREALVERLDLSGMGIDLVGYADDYASYPRADAWLKLVKELEVKAPACIALTTSMVACKAALTAGIRAVAIPDRYTGFQDFGGAHAVAERLEELDIVDLIS